MLTKFIKTSNNIVTKSVFITQINLNEKLTTKLTAAR